MIDKNVITASIKKVASSDPSEAKIKKAIFESLNSIPTESLKDYYRELREGIIVESQTHNSTPGFNVKVQHLDGKLPKELVCAHEKRVSAFGSRGT